MVGRLFLALALPLVAGAAHGACGWDGATYAPRPASATEGIRYRLTTTSLPPGTESSAIAERWRFELLDRRSGRRLSEIVLHRICGMGRAPCAVWPLGQAEEDSPFHSVIVELNADLSPVRGNGTPYAIVFANFAEHDWVTALDAGRVPGVRFFTRGRVLPDLSEQTVWVRTGCGRR